MKKVLSSLIIMFLCLGSFGCNTDTTQKKSNVHKSEQATFPMTVKDATNKEISFKEAPKRIVSLIPSNTEILFSIGDGKNVVGVTDFDNYPKEVKSIDKVGGSNADMTYNVEKIISLKPDLVLAHESSLGISADGIEQIKQAGINVFVVKNAATINDVYDTIQQVGLITGKTEQSKKVVTDMKTKLDEISKKTAKANSNPKVWLEISGPPEIYTAGKGTFLDEMISIVHAKNIAESEKGWVLYSEESAIKANPDVILTTYGDYAPNLEKTIMNRKNWKTVNAIKNKRVYDINADTTSRPGPRLAEGVEAIAKAVYPELFK
ncbi:ABC transporter substrate-binding protein [Bacillus sp. AFS055030]|uniref:ABC transporter substrate-binding protein n=1 Tax=Bacillus sp. AFS055030 TaxID=2033507 RepID=UPI000BFDC59C|nr:ABC transporter substrate-binding protein [Bacillus sp. AFS055030]PGL71985.1 ABC transporter substrate-binding protein [Bacillus sp. AFS055030]